MRTLIALLLLMAGSSHAQDVQVSQQNKTIAVTAEETVSVTPTVAVLHVGFRNYAPTSEESVTKNKQVSGSVVKALENLHITSEQIETPEFATTETEKNDRWTPEEWDQRRFETNNEWAIRVNANDAQRVLDAALHAGANYSQTPQWEVSDQAELQAKAGAAALEKARRIAQQMAKGLNAQLGELIYASNTAPASRLQKLLAESQELVEVNATPAERPATSPLRLFKEPVKSMATVHAVFAIKQ